MATVTVPATPPRDRDPALESLLAFWSDAGVEAQYADAPVDRTRAAPGAVGRAPPARASAPIMADRPAPAMSAPIALDTRTDDLIAAARRAAAEAADLDGLAAVVADFESFSLKPADAARAIFSRGQPEAAVMIIGAAPSADDEKGGEPFSGAAGRLLDAMLAAADLTNRAYLMHATFWRPPGDRAPTPAEFAVCAPFLERAIALVAPKALLLVGAEASRALLRRDESILDLRGRWLEWRSADGGQELPALPTLNPAFLLRQPQSKRKSWEDLLLLTERLDRPARP